MWQLPPQLPQPFSAAPPAAYSLPIDDEVDSQAGESGQQIEEEERSQRTENASCKHRVMQGRANGAPSYELATLELIRSILPSPPFPLMRDASPAWPQGSDVDRQHTPDGKIASRGSTDARDAEHEA